MPYSVCCIAFSPSNVVGGPVHVWLSGGGGCVLVPWIHYSMDLGRTANGECGDVFFS